MHSLLTISRSSMVLTIVVMSLTTGLVYSSTRNTDSGSGIPREGRQMPPGGNSDDPSLIDGEEGPEPNVKNAEEVFELLKKLPKFKDVFGNVKDHTQLAITSVGGGLSNTNYKITVPGELAGSIRTQVVKAETQRQLDRQILLEDVWLWPDSYIFRVPGDLVWNHKEKGTYLGVHLVDRELEHQCAMASFSEDQVHPESGSGEEMRHMSPKMVSYDKETGLMLTEWIWDGTILTATEFSQHGELTVVGSALREFHERVKFDDSFAASNRSTWFTPLFRADNYYRELIGAVENRRQKKSNQDLDQEFKVSSIGRGVDQHPQVEREQLLEDHFLPKLMEAARNVNKIITEYLTIKDEEKSLRSPKRKNAEDDHPPHHVDEPHIVTSARNLDGMDPLVHIALPKHRPVALHCDLNPANFARSTDGHTFIFDFEYCHYGHPLWDLANIVTFNGLDDLAFCRVFGGYIEKTPLDPEKGHHSSVDVLEQYLHVLQNHHGWLGSMPEENEFHGSCASGLFAADVLDALHAMKWLFKISEGLWGIVHEQVTDIPFGGAEWANNGGGDGSGEDLPTGGSYTDYGLKLLREAKEELEKERGIIESYATSNNFQEFVQKRERKWFREEIINHEEIKRREEDEVTDQRSLDESVASSSSSEGEGDL